MPSADAARRDLLSAIHGLIGTSLGAQVGPVSLSPRFSALEAGFIAAAGYAFLPAAQAWMGAPMELIVLSSWGAIYFGVVVALTRSTNVWVLQALDSLIVPALSEAAALTALAKLRSDVNRRRILTQSGVVTLIFVALSWVFFRRLPWQHFAAWAVGYFYLYFSAAIVTLTARFHLCLSHAIKEHPGELFELNPANSTIIFSASALANRLLTYWLCVFLLIVTLAFTPTLFASLVVDNLEPALVLDAQIRIQTMQTFVLLVIAIAGFFSFVFGSLVYLRFESDLRNAVERVRLPALTAVQQDYVACLRQKPENGSHLGRLESACAQLSQGALTRTAARNLGAGILTALPAIAGILAAIVSWMGRR